MGDSRSFLSRGFRLLRWPALIVVLLFGAQLTLLAFPGVLFSDRVRVGSVTVHHEGLPEEQALRLATEVDRRLRASRFHDPKRHDPVFVFRDRRNYERYLNLAFLRTVPSGFNLPMLRNSYVCPAVVDELGAATGGDPRFSIWDGELAHIAAHEVGHQYIADRIGVRRWRNLPHWKQEGLPEYIANIGAIRADPSLGLESRIGILRDDARWGATPPGRRPGWDRVHYEAGLLVEFLLDVRGMSLEELVSDRVTRDETYTAMISWASRF